MLLAIAISLLGLAAFGDGWSTNLAISRGARETDPVAVRIFVTSTPTPATVYVRGGIVIAAESALALSLAHFHHTAGLVVAGLLFVQAGVHSWETFHNLKLR